MDWPIITWGSSIGSWRLRLREHPPPIVAGEVSAIEVSSLNGNMPSIFRILLGKILAIFVLKDLPFYRWTCVKMAQHSLQPTASYTRKDDWLPQPHHTRQGTLGFENPTTAIVSAESVLKQRMPWSQAHVDPMSAYVPLRGQVALTRTYSPRAPSVSNFVLA